jgi:hypothetical protein
MDISFYNLVRRPLNRRDKAKSVIDRQARCDIDLIVLTSNHGLFVKDLSTPSFLSVFGAKGNAMHASDLPTQIMLFAQFGNVCNTYLTTYDFRWTPVGRCYMLLISAIRGLITSPTPPTPAIASKHTPSQISILHPPRPISHSSITSDAKARTERIYVCVRSRKELLWVD